MKILHVLAQKPGQTGSGVFLNSLVQQAAKRGYEQSVVIGIPRCEEVDFPIGVKVFPVYFETDELPFHVVGMSNEMPYRSTRYCDMTTEMVITWKKAFARQLQTAVTQSKPDIILSHHVWVLSVFTKELFPKIPVLAIAHGTGLRQLEQSPELAEYVKQGCRKLDLILALNETQKELIAEKFCYPIEKIVVTGAGYNSDIFYQEPKVAHDNVKIIYVGKLSKAKGVEILLKAIERIKIESVAFTLIGSASKYETASIMEQSAETFHSIMFTGALPQVELAEMMRQSDILVLPSFYEGMPLVIIEAIACGLNIVTTELPGIRKFLGEEFCLSDFISFVPLPRLEHCDCPLEQDLEKFEVFLKTALESQIFHIANHHYLPTDLIDRTVRQWNWESIFQRIEKQMLRFLPKVRLT